MFAFRGDELLSAIYALPAFRGDELLFALSVFRGDELLSALSAFRGDKFSALSAFIGDELFYYGLHLEVTNCYLHYLHLEVR